MKETSAKVIASDHLEARQSVPKMHLNQDSHALLGMTIRRFCKGLKLRNPPLPRVL